MFLHAKNSRYTFEISNLNIGIVFTAQFLEYYNVSHFNLLSIHYRFGQILPYLIIGKILYILILGIILHILIFGINYNHHRYHILFSGFNTLFPPHAVNKKHKNSYACSKQIFP